MKILAFVIFLAQIETTWSDNFSNIQPKSLYLTSVLYEILENADPYEMMSSVFVGNPSIAEIRPIVEGILKKYNLPLTDEYRLKVGSMALELRKKDNGRVTEMQLLRHILTYGSNKISLPNQAGYSYVILLKGE